MQVHSSGNGQTESSMKILKLSTFGLINTNMDDRNFEHWLNSCGYKSYITNKKMPTQWSMLDFPLSNKTPWKFFGINKTIALHKEYYIPGHALQICKRSSTQNHVISMYTTCWQIGLSKHFISLSNCNTRHTENANLEYVNVMKLLKSHERNNRAIRF